ncbi:MAG TPA: hypothetical protein DCE41_34045, partial [Cytophagales bacterium]|nr:hypothetical protein [Cytophagales bacterium]
MSKPKQEVGTLHFQPPQCVYAIKLAGGDWQIVQGFLPPASILHHELIRISEKDKKKGLPII